MLLFKLEIKVNILLSIKEDLTELTEDFTRHPYLITKKCNAISGRYKSEFLLQTANKDMGVLGHVGLMVLSIFHKAMTFNPNFSY